VTSKKIVFIVNPHAAAGAAGKNWPVTEAWARDCLGSFSASFTTGRGTPPDLLNRPSATVPLWAAQGQTDEARGLHAAPSDEPSIPLTSTRW
jgi:hypothetical protein